uniref:Uncharacterized protein n=1 Tax=Aplanochytrium stocchinoi TaxID=215587 RepID=A0A7S3PR80_9STRA
MPCLTLWPSTECGMRGECVEPENSTSFCRCEPGWSQSLELNFFTKDNLSSGLCNTHEGLLQTLYNIEVVFVVILILVQLYVINNVKQFKRAFVGLIIFILMFVASLYRLLREEEALFVDDLVFTFLVAQALGLMPYSMVLAFDKYLYYLEKKFSSWEAASGVASVVQSARKLGSLSSLIDFCASQLFWIATLNSSQLLGKRLTRGAIIIYASRNILNSVAIYFMFRWIARDLKRLQRVREELEIANKSKQNQAYSEWFRKILPQMKRTGNLTLLSNVMILVPFHLPAVFSDVGLQNLKYFIPVVFIVWTLSSLSLIRLKMVKMQKITKTKSMKTMNIVVVSHTSTSASKERRPKSERS